MVWPVFLNGEEAGTLKETREGLYRVFRADCEPREGLHRLWLHGAGASVYLGLLTPSQGRLRLVRRFSRAEAGTLPDAIDCARDRASSPTPLPVPPATVPAEEDGLLWSPAPGGALTAFDGRIHYLALPAALSPASPAAKRLRRINGKEFLVFRR